jgi:hypothetical protein
MNDYDKGFWITMILSLVGVAICVALLLAGT